MSADARISVLLRKYSDEILSDWVREQSAPGALRPGLIKEAELKRDCEDFLAALIEGTLKQPRLLAGAPRPVGAAELDWILRDSMAYW